MAMVVTSSLLMLSQDCFLGGSSSCSGSAGQAGAASVHRGAPDTLLPVSGLLAPSNLKISSSLHANCKQATHL